MAYRVDRKIPIPATPYKSMKYPWRSMKIGDSVRFPNKEAGLTAYAAARGYGKRHEARFRIQQEGKGMRIWRIA